MQKIFILLACCHPTLKKTNFIQPLKIFSSGGFNLQVAMYATDIDDQPLKYQHFIKPMWIEKSHGLKISRLEVSWATYHGLKAGYFYLLDLQDRNFWSVHFLGLFEFLNVYITWMVSIIHVDGPQCIFTFRYKFSTFSL